MGTMEIESALVSHTDWWPRPRWSAARRHHRRGDLRLRRAEAPRPTGDEAKAIAKELRDWVGREIGPIAKPRTSASATTCPRPAPARSCAACCARSPGRDHHDGAQHGFVPGGTPCGLTRLRPMMVPSGATFPSPSPAGCRSPNREDDVGQDARLDAAGVAGRGPLFGGRAGGIRCAVAGERGHAFELLLPLRLRRGLRQPPRASSARPVPS